MRALHVHLKQPAEHISADALRADVFCAGSIYGVLVAERDGALLGYALFHETYETIYAQRGLYLADLFVADNARRQGVARKLVGRVAHLARGRDLRFVWWVSETWDEGAQGFYAALGASREPMIAHSVSFESFAALADEGGDGKSS